MNYYKQGDPAKAEQIKAAFNGKGIYSNCNFANENYLYYQCDGKVAFCFIGGGLANIIKTHPDYQELELPVEPKFKVGDSLQSGSHFTKILSINLEEGRYYCDNRIISFENQDLWHLVPKLHYDIANFKPFDKVLVRDNDRGKWRASFFSYHIKGRQTCYPFCCIGNSFSQCIPYEGNEHLFGTTDMCDEMYINW